jgi:hypothetical protein
LLGGFRQIQQLRFPVVLIRLHGRSPCRQRNASATYSAMIWIKLRAM